MFLVEGLALSHELGNKQGVASALMDFAVLAVQGQRREDAERAARLYSAAEGFINIVGSDQIMRVDWTEHEQTIGNLRALLGEATFTTAWAEGQGMTLEQAITYALEDAE